MTNLDSIFKSRDITLPTKVRLVKAMVFPVVFGQLGNDALGCRAALGRQRYGAAVVVDPLFVILDLLQGTLDGVLLVFGFAAGRRQQAFQHFGRLTQAVSFALQAAGLHAEFTVAALQFTCLAQIDLGAQRHLIEGAAQIFPSGGQQGGFGFQTLYTLGQLGSALADGLLFQLESVDLAPDALDGGLDGLVFGIATCRT